MSRNSDHKNIVEQAGAVVYTLRDNQIRLLTVRSKKNPSQRIFPKGHIEPGESDVAAARRELLEEAGVRGERIGFGGTRMFDFRGKRYRVQYYIFRYGATVHGGEPGREPEFDTVDGVRDVLPFGDLKELLDRSIKVIRREESGEAGVREFR
ncbi:MAG: NUDIX hydrolase [Chitinispirillaceae bacterium]